MSEVKRVMIRSYDMTDVSRDTGEPRRIVDVPYVLASDYDRDLAEMRRQRDALKSATERLLGNFRLAIADKPVRDASETIAEAEAALTPKEPRDG